MILNELCSIADNF